MNTFNTLALITILALTGCNAAKQSDIGSIAGMVGKDVLKTLPMVTRLKSKTTNGTLKPCDKDLSSVIALAGTPLLSIAVKAVCNN